MLIAMTGATGFIGSHITHRLVESGHQVRALVRSTSKTDDLAALGADIRSGDLYDRGFLLRSLEGADIIINAAGLLGKWGVTEEELKLVNVLMVKHLLDASQDTGVRQFIHFSTPGVVGMVGVAPECMPMRPAGAYERTKCEAEQHVMACHRKGCIPVTVLRPDFVYGPGDLHKLRMFQAIKEGHFPVIWRGSSYLHPTHINDVVDGTMLCLDNPVGFGHTFNIAGPAPVTVYDMVSAIADELQVNVHRMLIPPVMLKLGALGVETVCRVAGKEPPVTRQQILFFTRDHASDISKAQAMLNYYPRIDLQNGIKNTIEWYRQEGCL